MDHEVVHEGAIDEHLVGLAEAEAGGVELNHLAVPRPPLHPHRGDSGRRWLLRVEWNWRWRRGPEVSCPPRTCRNGGNLLLALGWAL